MNDMSPIDPADLNQVRINVSGPEAQATLVRNVISRTLADLGAKMSGDVHPEAAEPLELVEEVPAAEPVAIWGPELQVESRPAWVADDDLIFCRIPYTKKRIAIRADDPEVCWDSAGTLVLKADHWAYPVLAKGFTPWPGGLEAPADWDGGEVLCSFERICPGGEVTSWFRHPDGPVFDIIGYRKRTPQPIGSATVEPRQSQIDIILAVIKSERETIRRLLAS